MSAKPIFRKLLPLLIAGVWLANGLFCKVFLLVPRHQLIVAHILGSEHAVLLTKTIGILETAMALWIVSSLLPRLCAATQIAVVAAMNLLEFFLVPHLLLFGRMNAVFALVFIGAVYYHEFRLNKKQYGSLRHGTFYKTPPFRR